MPSLYKIKKGDSFLQSKHADEHLVHTIEDAWIIVFYNEPKKGKATKIEYGSCNYPAVSLTITANWKAKQICDTCRKDSAWQSKLF